MLNFLKKIFWFGRKTLSQSEARKLLWFLNKTEKLDEKHAIIEIDKIYHNVLKILWYEGSFGEILKRNPKEIKNIDEIWKLHKLRNTLVHELENKNEWFLEKSAKTYYTLTRNFIRSVTK